jgi:lipopolysaccharide O-acetyltransferase
MINLDSRYSIPDFFRLAWSLLITYIFFRPARIIRQPTRIRGFYNMRLGKGFTTGQYCRIEASDHGQGGVALTIGDGVQINDSCHIAALNSIRIGNNVLIASQVFITDHDHGDVGSLRLGLAPKDRPLVYSPVVIEDNVWIGEKVIILKGVHVGVGAVIGAGAVVTRNVPAGAVVVGVPARVVSSVDS